MTIRQFSDKYGVPYPLAYGASYQVKPIATMTRDRDYPESEMYAAVEQLLTRRINYHRDMMRKDAAILRKMGIEVTV